MKNLFPIFGLFLIISMSIGSSGCAGVRMKKLLNTHQSALLKAANDKVPPQEKFDVLATSFTRVLDEAISFTNPKRSMKYVQAYAEQNKKSIDLITGSSGDYISNLSDAEKIIFATSLARKPYTKDLINNIPKFERKVGQKLAAIRFLGKLGDFFKPGKIFRF